MDDLIQEMLEPDRPAPGAVARRRRFVATTTIIGLAAIGITSLTTNALFTDTDESGQSGFVSGSIKIGTTPTDFVMVPDVFAAPGDHYYAPVVVTNEGTLQLRYAFSLQGVSDSTPLLENLHYSVITGLTSTQCENRTGPPDGPPAVTRIANGTLGTGSHWIGAGTAENLVTDDRVLDAGTPGNSEVLCIGLSFDIDAPDSVQEQTAGVEFVFHAEQTANNP